MSHFLLILLFVPIVLAASGLLYFLVFGFSSNGQERLQAPAEDDVGTSLT